MEIYKQLKKSRRNFYKTLDTMKKNLLQEKLMKITPIRLTESVDGSISRIAKEAGESKQTIIRQAIKEGLPIVEQKFLSAGAGEKNETNNQINK